VKCRYLIILGTNHEIELEVLSLTFNYSLENNVVKQTRTSDRSLGLVFVSVQILSTIHKNSFGTSLIICRTWNPFLKTYFSPPNIYENH